MSETLISVEVVYAAVERQVLMTVEVPAGSSVRQAMAASGIDRAFPELDLADCTVGIFGRVVSDPSVRCVEAGERIEIYRPLLADPMEARRQRAAKARQKRVPPTAS
ncbi:RnfH family protein [Pseudomonas alliivorans]|nr:RnfH family protein [Pseudomonas alliivorans]MEE4780495.1 RnfH family protein [Pseudomonas alliivorans]MEE4817759.1 RnfH family protein [Pseudomonas alliivorans]MEE4834263.1 RnfH family protein [Pseudomonas alliivorans]MEE4857110.1 RnfH family protein [Pseudomonas alliivorans]